MNTIGPCIDRAINALFSRPANDYKQCNPEAPDGCPRCKPIESTICCDMHSPEYFEAKLGPYDTKAAPVKRAPYKSSLKVERKDWVERDYQFLTKLMEWRVEKGTECFGMNALHTFGPQLFLSDDIVERLVKCYHCNKISTIEDFKREIDWNTDYIESYGPSLVSLIVQLTPAPTAEPPKQPKVRGCSACKKSNLPYEGHISTSSPHFFPHRVLIRAFRVVTHMPHEAKANIP